MENNQQDNSKPQIFCYGVKIETAIFEIAFLIGLLWSAFYIFIFFYFCDGDSFIAWLCSLLVYYPIFEIIRKAKHVNINKRGDSEAISYLILSLFFMSLLLGYVAFKVGHVNHELRRTPCDSSGQCPEWSNRCPKNFAQLLSIHPEPQDKPCCYSCYPYPNEGIVERVFERPENLRFLKRKILEMAANHTNLKINETLLLESQLKPYFDVDDDNNDTFESIDDQEANCELKRGRWITRVLCAEKVAKLKQAFMDIYWAQVTKRKMNSTVELKNGQIAQDEIDAIFVVPYNCDSLKMALKISIAFLISHLIIFVIFFQQLLRYFGLTMTIKCPFKCFTDKRSGDQLCSIGKMKIEGNEPAEKKKGPPSYQYALANCSKGPKKMDQNGIIANFTKVENIYVTPNFENCQILRF